MNLYFKLAYRNIKSHWRKSLAAILSISLGFMTMAIFEGYINQSRRLLVAGFTHRFMNGHIIIEKEGLWSTQGRRSPWQFYLTEQDQAEIGKILDSSSEVNVWMKGLRINGLLTNGRTSRIFTGIGYDLDKGKKLRTDVWYRSILYGDPLEDHPTKSVLVGQLLGRSIGCVPNPKVKIVRKGYGYPPGLRPFKCETPSLQFTGTSPSGQISAINLEVVGITDGYFKDMDARYVMMSLESAQALAHTKGVSYISVLLHDPSTAESVINRIKSIKPEGGGQLHVLLWKDHKYVGDLFRKIFGMLTAYRNFVTTVILLIVALSVSNTLVKIVKERTREIGTWRSIGYENGHLVRLFAAEAILLGAIGSIIGVILTVTISTWINSADILFRAGMFVEPTTLGIDINPTSYAIVIGILLIISVCASYLAIRSALRQKVAENLIHN